MDSIVIDLGRQPMKMVFLSTLTISIALFSSSVADAQESKEFSYSVRPKSLISITNNYGPVTVKGSANRQVAVRSISRSKGVSFESEHHGKRIALRSISDRPGTALAEYNVLVPRDSFLVVIGGGTLHVDGLSGDVVLESGTAPVEVSDIDGAHVHVKTMDGPITLTDIRSSRIDVRSINGNVRILNVKESWADVTTGGGRITYNGDPGQDGEYSLSSHSGDLEVSIPATIPIEIDAHSVNGESKAEAAETILPSTAQRSLFLKPGSVSMPRFVLRSFRGSIRLKRP
jgi:Putative adhesin